MAPRITAPPAGATLRGSIAVFAWDFEDLPIEAAFLYVGSSRGGSQHASRDVRSLEQTSVGDLPTDGSEVFVRLWYRTGNAWRFADEQYRAAGADGLPVFVDPLPDSQLAGPSQQFRWDVGDLPVDDTWLYVGARVGGSDYAARRVGTATSLVVDGLPTDERTVHVRLYVEVGGVWHHVDATYEAASVPVPSRDALTRELQSLVGVTADGIVGPNTRAALNRNWLGWPERFDPSFAERLTNDDAVVRWVQRRLNTRAAAGLALDGVVGPATDTALRSHLGRGGVVAAESFIELLGPGS